MNLETDDGIAQWIRKTRRSLEMSQAELADRAQLPSKTALLRIEAGQRALKWSEGCRIIRALSSSDSSATNTDVTAEPRPKSGGPT